MNVIPGEVIIEPASSRQGPQPQPIQALASNSEPVLDDAAVRAAVQQAVANNQDPQTITMDDFAQGFGQKATEPVKQAPLEVPQKFLKPDGAVDVDKLQTSTKQLDEAIQKKEEAVNKTVEDYLREYKEREAKFRNLPNPEKLAANLPPPAATVPFTPSAEVPPQNYEEVVRRDYQADPLGTTARLIDLIVQKRFEPLAEKEKMDSVRSNIQGLAEKDSRVLHPKIFAAINEKLQSDPDLWKLKNPHKAAWLEVKEELRLGEPTPVQAQPSRPSPVLGGGTPPSAPSSSMPLSQDILSNLHRLDISKKDQEALGDEAIRKALMGHRG